MFGWRTSEQAAEPVESDSAAKQTKGRPTPTRKEAEEARKLRLSSTRDRKGSAAQRRQRTVEQRAKVRQAMETGDERYLPARDRGPVKKLIRDYVDTRRTVGEYLLIVFFVALVIGWTVPGAAALSTYVFLVILVAMLIDSIRIVRGVKAEIRTRFPDAESKGETSGVTMYAVMRAWQMRRLRLPKPQVKHGDSI